MTKDFVKRVKREGIVDTKKYRYVYRGCSISRINIDLLDSTAALDKKNWEVIYVEKEYKEEMLAGELREMLALGWTPEEAEENPEAFLERIGQYADGLSEADVWRVWEAVLEQEFV